MEIDRFAIDDTISVARVSQRGGNSRATTILFFRHFGEGGIISRIASFVSLSAAHFADDTCRNTTLLARYHRFINRIRNEYRAFFWHS